MNGFNTCIYLTLAFQVKPNWKKIGD